MKLFAIKDIKAERYSPPQSSTSEGTFLRDIQSALSQPPQQPNPFFDHPEDFQLFEVGSFDVDTGVVTPCNPHKSLGMASDYRRAAASTAA